MQFRTLRADEIECRVGTVKDSGVSLLLYKDARCDMNILDETVGPENWQRTHEVVNGNLFCNVGIYISRHEDYGDFVWKQDVGTESRTEAEKGEASDSFKRACTNWGLGRELYTAPFIWIRGASKTDRFFVREIEYDENRKISRLVIGACDSYGNRTDENAFVWPREAPEPKEPATIGATRAKALESELKAHNVNISKLLKQYKVKKLEDLSEEQHISIIKKLKECDDAKQGQA